jgi:hypothetical protein
VDRQVFLFLFILILTSSQEPGLRGTSDPLPPQMAHGTNARGLGAARNPPQYSISTDTFAQLCDTLTRALPSACRTALKHVRLHLHSAHEVDAAWHSLHTLVLPLPMADVHIARGITPPLM